MYQLSAVLCVALGAACASFVLGIAATIWHLERRVNDRRAVNQSHARLSGQMARAGGGR